MSGLRLNLRLGLSGQARGSAAFNPISLFTGAYDGGVFDAASLANQYQTTDTSTPAAVDSPVGRAGNLFTNSENALQATAATRPILRQSGSVYWWETDGVDDRLQADFGAGNLPCDLIVALRMIVLPGNAHVVGGPVLACAGTLMYLYSGTSSDPLKSIASGIDYVVTCRFDGSSSRMALDGGTYQIGNPGGGSNLGIAIGNALGGGAPTNIRLHRLFYRFGGAVLSDAEVAQVVTWCAAGQGRVL